MIFKICFQELMCKIGLRLGWLRAVARGYTYSYNKMLLGSNFQKNLKVWGIKFGLGLDGCARWHKVTITITTNLSWNTFQKNS